MNINLLITVQVITMSFCFFALFAMLNRDMKLQQRQIEFVIFGCVIADIGMLVELISNSNVQIMSLGRGIQIIGTCFFMLSLVSLTGYVCKISIPMWFSGTLLVVDTAIVLCQFVNNGGWFYQKITVESHKGYHYMVGTLGPAGILFWMISVIFPFMACIIMLIYSAIQSPNQHRKRSYICLSLVYIVVILSIFIHKQGSVLPYFNPSMGLASIIFSYLVFSKWKYQGIDIVAAAAQTAIDSIAGGVITLNQYREILYFNEAAGKMVPEIIYCLGLPIDNLNLNIPSLSPGEETEMSFNGRKYYVSLSAICDSGKSVHGYAIMFNDMTEMFDLMEMIKEEQRRADEASQVKTMFLANISHEIRTPMNAIMGLSDLIIEESRGRKVYDMAVTIKKAANSLLDLVNNVLDISKLESGKMELNECNYSIDGLIKDTMSVMEIPAAQQGLALKYNIDENLPCLLRGDDGKIKQCLINLINNGLKFTEKGHVRLDVSGIRRGDSVALTFMIIDTGCGIKKEDLKRVFGEFEQVDKILNKGKEGSGLGLTITKQLVELMGGVIDVSSEYGQGTTFTIRLTQTIVNETPISLINDIVEDIIEEPRMFVAPSTKTLIVDDNKVNLMVAKGLMEPYSLLIDTASSGEEAVEMVKQKNYDVIMMDHMMPGIDGVEATRQIREYYSQVNVDPYVIALTANAFGDIKNMFLSHGFQDFISKPIEKNKLHSALLKAIPDEKREFIDDILAPEEYTEDELAELFMENVDVRAAFELHGCNAAEYMELLELYLNEGKGKIVDIRNAYESKDWRNYSIFTHGLKSSSINIGATDLSEKAKKHEFASKDPNLIDEDFINNDYEALMSAYENVLSEAARVIEKQRKKNNNSVEENKLDGMGVEELREAVSKIIDLSEDFKSKEAAEEVENLLKYKLDTEVEEMLNEVRMKYKLYDDDGAEDMLHNLMNMISDTAEDKEG